MEIQEFACRVKNEATLIVNILILKGWHIASSDEFADSIAVSTQIVFADAARKRLDKKMVVRASRYNKEYSAITWNTS